MKRGEEDATQINDNSILYHTSIDLHHWQDNFIRPTIQSSLFNFAPFFVIPFFLFSISVAFIIGVGYKLDACMHTITFTFRTLGVQQSSSWFYLIILCIMFLYNRGLFTRSYGLYSYCTVGFIPGYYSSSAHVHDMVNLGNSRVITIYGNINRYFKFSLY